MKGYTKKRMLPFHAKYSLSKLFALPSFMDVYGLLGFTGWRTRIIHLPSAYEGIQIRSATGTGGLAGAGIRFNYQKWGLHTQMVFIAGNDNYQCKEMIGNPWISSSQLQMMLSYRFSPDGSHP